MPCPCGHQQEYDACCGRLHRGEADATSAEQLMRSRYSAFAKGEIDYLHNTTWPPAQKHFDAPGYRDRAAGSVWLGLTIHETQAGMDTDTRGTVTFTARSMIGGEVHNQTEKSLFRKKLGRWYYVKPV